MNVARCIGSALLVVWGMSAPLVQAQNLDSVLTNQQMSGGEMMTELVRLTMVPLAESPILMRGMASFEFQSSGKTTLGEFRWNENDQLLWTDDVTLRSQMSLWMEDQKLAAYNLETQQGSFWPEAMVDGSGLLPSSSERITLKASKTESNLQFRDWTCLPYEGKLDKDRVMVWMAEEEVAGFDAAMASAYREAFMKWARLRVGHPVVQRILITEGIPVALSWGTKEGLTSHMKVVDLSTKARVEIDAPNILMLVPGRDINQVAREYKEKMNQGQKAPSPQD